MNSSLSAISSPSPLPALDHQDQVFSQAFSTLAAAISARAFPAASIAITHKGRLIALKAFGCFTYPPYLDRSGAPSSSRSLREELALSERSESKGGVFDASTTTLFDLSSLTKVVATTTTAMILYQRGLLDLEAPVAAIVPEFTFDPEKDPRRREVSFRTLLAHSSGLPAHDKLYLKYRDREELLRAVFKVPLTADPGKHAEYSDIGFIILGAALERIAGESLDRICQREIFGPLGMTNTTFNPPQSMRNKIPPTQNDESFRHRIIQGEVQDENASVLGGIAAHAGLFSTAEDIARFAHAMLNGGRPILRPETIALFTRREDAPAGTSRTLGWDTPSSPSQSGQYFGDGSFGHLGYTGTSLWIDPARQLSITLLTNRTWPDCSNESIRQVRPRFHDAVIEVLLKSVVTTYSE